MTDHCWTHPDYIATVERLRSEIESQQLRNANLVEQMELLRNKKSAEGQPYVRPRTQEEKVAFRIWWDEQYERGQERARLAQRTGQA